ncbi:MAG: excinuclease ABC subunit UvrA [Planctomycetes bacterium]|nr:excinuclease ABC subunit UvrA [Planctomycetota bacterium]
MSDRYIRIRKARQNNLAGIDVDIPQNRLIAVTGVSGSGKSSLAFDTLFREGQRRFLETLSAYARQFLGNMEKPDVESVEGLSPAIAVDQKSIQRGARSTVGTLTEIVDHLRVLFARAGRPHCPACKLPVRSQTPEEIVQIVLREHEGRNVTLMAPLIRDRKGSHVKLFEDLRKQGFVRARVDGVVHRIEDVPELERYMRHSIEVVIDRIKPEGDKLSRLREAIEQALAQGKGDLILAAEGEEDRTFSTSRTCPGCGGETPPLEPRLFSFNSPHGACVDCQGLGERLVATERAIIKDSSLTLRQGCLTVTRASGGALLMPHVDFGFLDTVAEAHDFDLDTPWKDLPRAAQKVILFGTGEERFEDQNTWAGKKFSGSVKWKRRFTGVIPAIEKAVLEGKHKSQVSRFLAHQPCTTCDGSRLKPAANAVLLAGVTFAEITRTPIAELQARLDGLELSSREQRIARDLLSEIHRRIDFLLEVGLSYLTLDRGADSLSGGEAQRIRLAAQLGAGLQGVLYVLDEPSIGLHARDHGRLLGALRRLRDAGNTVCVVEHDESTLRAADWVIDIGPGAGRHGGRIVAQGPPSEIKKSDTPTGRLLRGEIELATPAARRKGNGNALVVEGAHGFNLKHVDVSFPLGTLTVVTGVSGSGKSTLVNRIVERAVRRHLGLEAPLPEGHTRIRGLEHIQDLVTIDAAPIGRTPRSNPGTYIGVLNLIRDLFASLPEAKMRGYTKSRFSFNVAGGRCEACGGAGAKYVELQFLAPVTVPCDECGGHRFQTETLDVKYKGHSIADVLALTAEDALTLFADHPKIARPLAIMIEVGLGYLTLGQPSTTISGGEAQRMKLTAELQKRPKGHTLYVLDEPTTGLHMNDVARLVAALQKLVDLGHTVLVIEHNLDLALAADHVIDLGPEGGEHGGELVAQGTPEEIEKVARSHTGVALAAFRDSRAAPLVITEPAIPITPVTRLTVTGAKTHNLKNIDVSIPRDALTIVTGPSGSGKSSLALDTIFTEGRRRFVESLSTYARQFLGTKDRPPIERIEGLGPSVAVEARASGSHPRSTVATTTEIHDHLRVLWSRTGTRRCPEHKEKLERQDASRIARQMIADAPGATAWIVAPIFGPHRPVPDDFAADLLERQSAWRSAGFVRVLVDGVEVRIDDDTTALEPRNTLDLVIDRLKLDVGVRARVAEAVEQAESTSGGMVGLVVRGADKSASERHLYSTHGACPQCGFHIEGELEPRHFSFNTHVGACPECDGLGEKVTCDAELLFEQPALSIEDGALHPKLGRYLSKGKGYYEMLLRTVARAHRIDLSQPWNAYTDEQRALIAYGVGSKKSYKVEIERSTQHAEIEETFVAAWPGFCGHIDAWRAKTEDPEWAAILESVMARRTCAACAGERLRPDVRAVTIGKLRLPELLRISVDAALSWIVELESKADHQDGVEPVIAEVRSRLALLERVGLGYLTLDRHTSTLSGGEARRVRLSASLGSQLVGVCYVLDEPTVGLHPADVSKLTDALLDLRTRGNTVIVVEHDPSLMARADWIVDMGPGAGVHGGTVVVSGPPDDVRAHPTSLTGAAMRGDIALTRPARDPAQTAPRETIKLAGARTHNLKGVDFEFAFGEITGVCGPSGSGKSTLVLDTLVPALSGEAPAGRWKRLFGAPGGSLRTVVVDAGPIGRTPASIPATYTGVMEPIRELFARSPEARLRGFDPGRFSFNSPKGRCPACEGRGATKVEMQFLADLWLSCEECDGRRYAPDVLEVRWRGKHIAEVLDMTVAESLEFFAHHPQITVVLQTLRDVGLGYMRLGQSSTTLSGGEAQRVKLASELFRADASARGVVILDEPSTGLATSDVVHLLTVLDRLARRGNAVVVIEHHTGLLAACDQLVELGPTGGEEGGRIVAVGTPRDLVANAASVTGPWLALDEDLPRSTPRGAKPAAKKRKAPKKVVG